MFVFFLFSGIYLPFVKALDQRVHQNFLKQDSTLCTIGSEILRRILKFLPPTDVVYLSHTCKQLYQKIPFYLVKSGNCRFTTYQKANSENIWFEGQAINFFVSKINILIASNYVGKIVVWMQIIRNGKAILESEKSHTASGVRKSNFQFEENNNFLKTYRPGDRIRFIAGLPAKCLQKSINCTFQVSLQLKHYTYSKSLYVIKKDKFNTSRMGYSEYESPGIFLEWPEVVKCLPRVDSLSLLCSPNGTVAGDTYFLIIKFLSFILDYMGSF